MSGLEFQYCPKLAVFDRDRRRLLLCRRKGEQDFDGTFSLIGGKMEHSDPSIVDGIRREKNEEVGNNFMVRIFDKLSVDVFFHKKDGSRMILPHFYCEHIEGDIELSEEYSEWLWATFADLEIMEPIIKNILWIAPLLKKVGTLATDEDFKVI